MDKSEREMRQILRSTAKTMVKDIKKALTLADVKQIALIAENPEDEKIPKLERRILRLKTELDNLEKGILPNTVWHKCPKCEMLNMFILSTTETELKDIKKYSGVPCCNCQAVSTSDEWRAAK